jgi:hypothetical protein
VSLNSMRVSERRKSRLLNSSPSVNWPGAHHPSKQEHSQCRAAIPLR